MTHGISADGTIRGITDMQDGTAVSTGRTTADGTEAGIRSGRDIILDITRDTILDITLTTLTLGKARDIRQDRTGSSPAGQPAEEVSALHPHHAGI